MNLHENFTEAQIERVFTHHEFAVIEKEVPFSRHIHGSHYEVGTFPGKFVENPMNNDLIPLHEAFNRLMDRYIQNILFGFTKADIIQSLTQ